MGHKYALLILPVHSLTEPSERQIDEATKILFGKFSDLVGRDATDHWKTWLGTFAWDTIEKGKVLCVLTQAASDNPGLLDQENQSLVQRLVPLWEALGITRVLPVPNGEAWIFSGALDQKGEKPRLSDIRSFVRYPSWVYPWYCQQAGFHLGQPIPPKPWIDNWLATACLLDQSENKAPLLLRVGVRGFISARTRVEVEFRIADFVRVAETILALPKRSPTGGPEFVKRALWIAHRLCSDAYLAGWDLETKLLALYNHRSDCVHGKVPFEELLEGGEAGKLEVAKFEYLAEHVARAALLTAFRPANHRFFFSRPAIEEAWMEGTFPGCS